MNTPAQTDLSVESRANPTPDAQSQSGFAPIPTRLQDLAPLVVSPDPSNIAAVHEQLSELDEQLATIHATSAEAWVSQGEYNEALKHAEIAVTLTPDDMCQLNQCGFLRYLCEDDDGAIAAFSRVIEQFPEQADALVNLGMVEFGRENYAIAKDWFLRAIRETSDDSELWNNLGACIFQAGNTTEAAAYFRKALEFDPNNDDAKSNLACC